MCFVKGAHMPKDRTKQMPSRERIIELLDYDQETGDFRWKQPVATHTKVGNIAGGICPTTGYRRIRVDGIKYKASRLAWLMVYGDPVPFEVDHINRIRADDRIANLRNGEADNMRNKSVYKTNKVGVAGVNFNVRHGKWISRIQVAGKRISLGYFDTADEAIAARIQRETALREIGEWV
jgi:hypothetical protein